MLEVESSRSEVEKHTAKRLNDLTSIFSRYDLISEDEREAHLQEAYVPAVTEIASNLEVLSKEDARYSGVKEALTFLKKNKGLENFDPRYLSSYSTSWSKKPDIESKVNQRLIDLEKALGIEETPEARFALLNSLRYLAGSDIDAFELRVHESYAKGLVDTVDELGHNFDVITLPYNLDQEKEVGTEQDNGSTLSRFTRREFEGYILRNLYEGVAKEIGDKWMSKTEYHGELEEKADKYLGKHSLSLEEFCNRVDGSISDESMEDFAKAFKQYAVDAFLFNKLFGVCRRTKEDLRVVDGQRDHFLEKVKSLHGRNVYLNFSGKNVMEDVEKMDISNDLTVIGRGDYRFSQTGKVKVGRDFVCSGRGYRIMAHRVEDLKVGRNFTRTGEGYECLQKIESIQVGGDMDISGKGGKRLDGDQWHSKENGIVRVSGNFTFNGMDESELMGGSDGSFTNIDVEIGGEIITGEPVDGSCRGSFLKVGGKEYKDQKSILKFLKSQKDKGQSGKGKVITKKLKGR